LKGLNGTYGRTQKDTMLSNFFKFRRNPKDTSPLVIPPKCNQSHFLQQVQVATRLNQIMISITIILLCNFFVLLDCPFMLLLWLIFQIFMLLQRRRNQNYSHLKTMTNHVEMSKCVGYSIPMRKNVEK